MHASPVKAAIAKQHLGGTDRIKAARSSPSELAVDCRLDGGSDTTIGSIEYHFWGITPVQTNRIDELVTIVYGEQLA